MESLSRKEFSTIDPRASQEKALWVTVHDLYQMALLHEQAQKSDVAVFMLSSPAAGRSLGLPLFLSMLRQARLSVKGAMLPAFLDCGQDAAAAVAALAEEELAGIVFGGNQTQAKRLIALAQAHKRLVLSERPKSLDLGQQKDPQAALAVSFRLAGASEPSRD